MPVVFPEAIVVALLSIFLFLTLAASLTLVIVSLRRPTSVLLAIAAGLVMFALVLVVIAPLNVPILMGLILALVGGDPVTRRVLDLAVRGRVRETDDGGILISAPPDGPADDAPDATTAVLRGGTTIGYLERIAVGRAIVAGYPEAIAVVVAIKGVGRFSELASAEARERFIIGTLSSLLWACVVGALVRLAIW